MLMKVLKDVLMSVLKKVLKMNTFSDGASCMKSPMMKSILS